MKKVYFLVFHPFDIPLFVGFKNMLKENDISIKSMLLVIKHPYFEKTKGADIFFDDFDEVVELPYCNFSVKKPLKFLKTFLIFKKKLNSISLEGNSVLFMVCKAELSTSLVCKEAKRSKNVKVVLFQQYTDLDNKLIDFGDRDVAGYKKDWLMNLIFFMFHFIFKTYKIKQIYSIVDRKLKNRYIPDIEKVFDSLVIFKNSVTEKLEADNEMYFPYCGYDDEEIIVNKIQELKIRYPVFEKFVDKNKKIVIFFGGAFLDWNFIEDKELFIKKTNDFIDLIIEKHKNCIFVYVPHSIETGEYKYLNLEKFIILRNVLNAEMFFTLFGKKIEFVYSVKSTAAKTSLAFGIPSLLFYKGLPFKNDIYRHFDSFLGSSMSSDINNFKNNNYDIGKVEVRKKILESFRKINSFNRLFLK